MLLTLNVHPQKNKANFPLKGKTQVVNFSINSKITVIRTLDFSFCFLTCVHSPVFVGFSDELIQACVGKIKDMKWKKSIQGPPAFRNTGTRFFPQKFTSADLLL